MARVVIDSDGDKMYFNDQGECHREDGPAVIYRNGNKVWYENNRWILTKRVDGELYQRSPRGNSKLSYPSGYFVFKEAHGFIVWPEL